MYIYTYIYIILFESGQAPISTSPAPWWPPWAQPSTGEGRWRSTVRLPGRIRRCTGRRHAMVKWRVNGGEQGNIWWICENGENLRWKWENIWWKGKYLRWKWENIWWRWVKMMNVDNMNDMMWIQNDVSCDAEIGGERLKCHMKLEKLWGNVGKCGEESKSGEMRDNETKCHVWHPKIRESQDVHYSPGSVLPPNCLPISAGGQPTLASVAKSLDLIAPFVSARIHCFYSLSTWRFPKMGVPP